MKTTQQDKEQILDLLLKSGYSTEELNKHKINNTDISKSEM